MMSEKKQNINLYKQLADRQDETNRQLENEVVMLRQQQSIHVNAMTPEDMEILKQEQEELERMEHELKTTQMNKFKEYKNTQFEEPQYANTHNILGKQAYAENQIPANNQMFHQEEMYQQDQFGQQRLNNNVLTSNSNRFDEMNEMVNPVESRVIHQQNHNVFSRGPQSFQNSQKSMGNPRQNPLQTNASPYGGYNQSQGGYARPPPSSGFNRPPQQNYNNQPQFHSRMQHGSYRAPSNNYSQRQPNPMRNPLQQRPMQGGMRPGSNRMHRPNSNRGGARNMRSPKNNPLMRRV